MGLLDELMSGGGQQREFQDFVGQFEQGAPHENISDSEAQDRYHQMAGQVDHQTYQASAQDALGQMQPDDRAQFAQQVHEQAGAQGIDSGWDGRSTDPSALAQMTANVHQQSPGLLGSLLGSGGMGSGGMGSGGMGGITGGLGSVAAAATR